MKKGSQKILAALFAFQ